MVYAKRAVLKWGLAAVLLGMALPGSASAADAPESYPVGVARVDITPDYPVRLSGFGFRRAESEGITQRIWAKALAIGDDEDGPLVLVAVDNLGIPAEMWREVARRLANAGVRPQRLAITATHTHTAPMLAGVAPTLFGQPIPEDQQQRIDRYTRELTDKLEAVARAALADRRPASLAWARGKVEFARNRRKQPGPVDHDLPLLVVKSPDGELRAVWISYACHCVTLSNNKISGDWAGYAQELIEGNHPGAVALVSIGCGADANPSSGVAGDRVDLAQAQGMEIAAEVKRLVAGPLEPLPGKLEAQLQTIELEFDTPPTRAEWEQRAQRNDAVGYHARVQLERLDRGERLQEKIDYPIQTWSFGDALAVVFLPGEVVVDYAVRLKRELDESRLWINAYANDAPCYIPSERVLKEGGYEAEGAMIYYDRPGRLKPGLEQKIIDAVVAQIGERFGKKQPADPRSQTSSPRSPQQSLAAIRTKENLVVELVAAEPLVVDPVAIDFGPDGRLWVAEMHDYPEGIDGAYQPGGRVKVLEDSDGDGRYDEAAVFLDGIPFPTGITVWRRGVLVCAAPDILYAEDTDGDGRADVRRALFTGFDTHNYQARVNSLQVGLDGWVYGSGGLFGGQVRSFAGGDPHDLANRDFRMQPDTGAIEPATGRSQQGRVRDNWGNWFACTNSRLLLHYPLADHDLRRNPQVAPPSLQLDVLEGADPMRLYPLAENAQRFKLSGPPNRVTAACGLGIYRDVLLGEEYRGNAFTCEPVNLVVHRRVLSPEGTTFRGRRAADESQSEFVASTDPWFRPVQVRTGPDGALWIVDMYRYVIEHPRWIPPETLAQLDLRAGDQLGRIYRVYPRERPPRPVLRLDPLDAGGLVAALESPNGPQRDLAGQMLVWNEHRSVAPLLEELVAGGRVTRPETRLQALVVLDGLQALRPETLLMALKDSQAGVRRHAVRLAQGRLDLPGIADAVVALLDDPDPQVQLQIACTLGAWKDAAAGQVLAMLVRRHQHDPYLLAAVLSSLNAASAPAASEIVLGDPQSPPSPELAERFIAADAGVVDDGELPLLLDRILEPESDRAISAWQFAALASFFEATSGRQAAVKSQIGDDRQRRLDKLLAEARQWVGDARRSERDRVAAVSLLGLKPESCEADRRALAEQLVPQNSAAFQSAVVAALARHRHPDVPRLLLARWQAHSPALQGQILDVLLGRDDWLQSLLAEWEGGKVALRLDAARRQRLLEHRDPQVRQRAERLLQTAVSADRAGVLVEYRTALELPGDGQRGAALFAKACGGCHRLGSIGQAAGPDLAALSDKSPPALLEAILDPNRAVDARYLAYVAITTDGRVQTGMITAETATSITLRAADGREQVVRRGELAELQSSGKSLMPDGFEKDLSVQDMADLIAYLVTEER